MSDVMRNADELIHRVRQWPFIRVEAHAERVVLRATAGDAPIAEIDRVTGALCAFVPADLRASLVRAEPLVSEADGGVAITLTDEQSRRAGERVLRRRVDLERFGAQFREASP
jgi:hypothetical protein